MANAILLIDTSSRPGPDVSAQLVQCGLAVQVVRELPAAVRVLRRDPDLLVLLRPDDDAAVDECRRLSAVWDGLTAVVLAEHDEQAVVRCLEAGADSVLDASLSRRELEARLRALLERRSRLRPVEGRRDPRKVGDLIIDPETYAVTKRGHALALTPTEFRLLASLARHAGQTVPHEELMFDVWGDARPENVDHLRLYIRYLRQKIEDDQRRPRLLLNQRGVGYRLAVDARVESRSVRNGA